MIHSTAEKIARTKAIKVLMATWKQNLDLRQKAFVLLQLNPQVRIKKMRNYLTP
ncbi:MAG: hypothetical protein ABJB86_18060 [Bacteroidota bacterium]